MATGTLEQKEYYEQYHIQSGPTSGHAIVKNSKEDEENVKDGEDNEENVERVPHLLWGEDKNYEEVSNNTKSTNWDLKLYETSYSDFAKQNKKQGSALFRLSEL